MEYATLHRLTRDALKHLHDRSYLATHPLASLLGREDAPLSAEALRREVLAAIDVMKPEVGFSLQRAEWRQFQHLTFRYVEGRTRDDVARALGVSQRQASRDHEQAIGALTRVLWLSLQRNEKSNARSPSGDGNGAKERARASDPSEEITEASHHEESAAVLAEVLRGVLATVERLVAVRDVSFTLAVPDTLPALAIAPSMLRQALLNLLVFAAQAEPRQTLYLHATDTAAGVLLSVDRRASDGSLAAAIEPDWPPTVVAAEVLQLFETGRNFLELQGGSAELGVHDPAAPLITVLVPPIALRKVLVVDDNPDVVGLFRRYLRGEPYRLIQATTGASALRLARELQPEIVILDVMLPAVDGWDVLRLIREQPDLRGIAIIVCSILPERALALSAGVQAFLAKPVARQDLLDTLKSCLPGPSSRAPRESTASSRQRIIPRSGTR
jgi:CheY-like chemotaxis protein